MRDLSLLGPSKVRCSEPEEELAAVIAALDWACAPTTDDALGGVERVPGTPEPDRGYAPAGRVRALYSRERMEANRQRLRADRYREALEAIADYDPSKDRSVWGVGVRLLKLRRIATEALRNG